MKPAPLVSCAGLFATSLAVALELGGATLLVACSSSSPASSTSINASGGSVKTGDGAAVSVPAGALAQATVITIGSEPNAISISDVVLVGPAYRFGPEGTQFAVPVTVTVPYDPSSLPSGETATDVVIMTAPVGSSDFVPLTTSIVDATHVTATTAHFSSFVATARKMARADLAVTPADQGTSPMDLGQSTHADSSSLCPHVWNGTQCTLTAIATTCGGSFSLNCAQTICFCSGAPNQGRTCPKPSPNTNMLTCPSQADAETIWTTCCAFP